MDRVDNLPTLPQIFGSLNRIVESNKSSASDLVGVISSDQSLTARVLKYANSPVFRALEPIDNVQQAVVRLGFEQIKEISLSIMVYDGLFRESAGMYFNRLQFWKHSLLVGYACSEVVEKLKVKNMKHVAFAAGLLHDIGIVVMDRFFPERFSRLIKMIDARRDPLEQLEMCDEHPSHCQVGAYVLDKWHLPQSVSEAVSCHHGPTAEFKSKPLAGIIHLADFVVRKNGYPFYASESLPEGSELYKTMVHVLKPHIPDGLISHDFIEQFDGWFHDWLPDCLTRLDGLWTGLNKNKNNQEKY